MIKKFFKKFDYRHLIMSGAVIASLICSIYVFPFIFLRVIDSLKDFASSIINYFCFIFKIPTGVGQTVTDVQTDFGETILPIDYDSFKYGISLFPKVFFNKTAFGLYSKIIFNGSYNFLLALTLIIPVIFVFYFIFKRAVKSVNNNYNKDSKALKAFKCVERRIIFPICAWVNNLVDFIKNHNVYVKLLFAVWLYNFNFFTIIIEAVAFYYYFCSTFSFVKIYTQIVKLFLDLNVIIKYMPLIVKLIIATIILLIIRKRTGFKRLNHNEMKNRGFISSTSICTFLVGPMGVKKTTSAVDMILSIEVMFRDKAYEMIVENDMKFPNVPWINVEREIKQAVSYHEIYNLVTCRKWAEKKRKRFEKNPMREKVFDYDYKTYRMIYDDSLSVKSFWEILKSYTQLFFIYIIESSLTVSNLGIRSDNVLMDEGNFPMWYTDFFRRRAAESCHASNYAHILDFDVLRLGKRVVAENEKSGSFEFGVIMITEIGKDRGNMIENQDKKKSDEEANPKNDMFNSALKLIRHPATVDNYCFCRVVSDDQRPESLGADARELCQILHVKQTNETKLAMPFFFVEELLHSFVFDKFGKLYSYYRYERGDNTLYMYLIKKVSSRLHNYYTRIYNTFSYFSVDMDIESGTMDGDLKRSKYYLSPKKVYSKRFATDCFQGFFEKKAEKCLIGLDDYPCFLSERATYDELQSEKSYFIRDLSSVMSNDVTKAEKKEPVSKGALTDEEKLIFHHMEDKKVKIKNMKTADAFFSAVSEAEKVI